MEKLKLKRKLGKTSLQIPPIIFGTSCLGNLYQALEDDVKFEIIKEWFRCVESPVAIDTAGKYGAGLSLEVIGRGLHMLGINPEEIIISNKLGWFRIPLKTPEPTFEPGVWANLKNDAIAKINYPGIIACYEQGLELLNGYKTDIVSVHDPDEYLAAADSKKEYDRRFNDILDAYTALFDLKAKGEVKAIGVGSKDWRIIRQLTDIINLDWVMLAVSFTIMNHPADITEYIQELTGRGIPIINSAVFHGGFLTGGQFFDYRLVDRTVEKDKPLFEYRDKFYQICKQYEIKPAEACVAFAMTPPGVVSIALNTSNPKRISQNVNLVKKEIPEDFWRAMKDAGLINRVYPYTGHNS
jgi:D-threo-aldose 1-dehydrogenase